MGEQQLPFDTGQGELFDEAYEVRLQVMHDYERLLEQSLVAGEISAHEFDDGMSAMEEWVELGTEELVRRQAWLMPEDNIDIPPYEPFQ